MKDFIKTQLKLYQSGKSSISFEKIKQLAQIYLSLSEYDELFNQKKENFDNIEEK